MNQMVNIIQLIWKLTWMLRTYKTCNLMVRFSKYEFYNKLLSGVTLLITTPNVTWTRNLKNQWLKKGVSYNLNHG